MAARRLLLARLLTCAPALCSGKNPDKTASMLHVWSPVHLCWMKPMAIVEKPPLFRVLALLSRACLLFNFSTVQCVLGQSTAHGARQPRHVYARQRFTSAPAPHSPPLTHRALRCRPRPRHPPSMRRPLRLPRLLPRLLLRLRARRQARLVPAWQPLAAARCSARAQVKSSCKAVGPCTYSKVKSLAKCKARLLFLLQDSLFGRGQSAHAQKLAMLARTAWRAVERRNFQRHKSHV